MMTPEQQQAFRASIRNDAISGVAVDRIVAAVESLLAAERAATVERAEALRAALSEIADSKSLTATPTQFYQHLQRLAAKALNADAQNEGLHPECYPSPTAIRAQGDGK